MLGFYSVRNHFTPHYSLNLCLKAWLEFPLCFNFNRCRSFCSSVASPVPAAASSSCVPLTFYYLTSFNMLTSLLCFLFFVVYGPQILCSVEWCLVWHCFSSSCFWPNFINIYIVLLFPLWSAKCWSSYHIMYHHILAVLHSKTLHKVQTYCVWWWLKQLLCVKCSSTNVWFMLNSLTLYHDGHFADHNMLLTWWLHT